MSNPKNTVTETIEVRGKDLVKRVRELVKEGNVRRLIITRPDDSFRVEVPLTAGATALGLVTLLAPWLTIFGTAGLLLLNFRIEIERAAAAPSSLKAHTEIATDAAPASEANDDPDAA